MNVVMFRYLSDKNNYTACHWRILTLTISKSCLSFMIIRILPVKILIITN